MTPVVRLWEHVGLGLIVEDPGGILYSNQTGGHACIQPQMRGFFIPLRNDTLVEGRELLSPENELHAYFTGPKHKGTGATRGLDSEGAELIAAVLQQYNLDGVLEVDASRLQDSHEASRGRSGGRAAERPFR